MQDFSYQQYDYPRETFKEMVRDPGNVGLSGQGFGV